MGWDGMMRMRGGAPWKGSGIFWMAWFERFHAMEGTIIGRKDDGPSCKLWINGSIHGIAWINGSICLPTATSFGSSPYQTASNGQNPSR